MTANHSTDNEKEMPTFGPWSVFKSMVTDNRIYNLISITSW